jgi:hypothetical protein
MTPTSGSLSHGSWIYKVTLGYDRMVVGFIKGLLGSSSYGSRIHKGTVGVVNKSNYHAMMTTTVLL